MQVLQVRDLRRGEVLRSRAHLLQAGVLREDLRLLQARVLREDLRLLQARVLREDLRLLQARLRLLQARLLREDLRLLQARLLREDLRLLQARLRLLQARLLREDLWLRLREVLLPSRRGPAQELVLLQLLLPEGSVLWGGGPVRLQLQRGRPDDDPECCSHDSGEVGGTGSFAEGASNGEHEGRRSDRFLAAEPQRGGQLRHAAKRKTIARSARMETPGQTCFVSCPRRGRALSWREPRGIR